MNEELETDIVRPEKNIGEGDINDVKDGQRERERLTERYRKRQVELCKDV